MMTNASVPTFWILSHQQCQTEICRSVKVFYVVSHQFPVVILQQQPVVAVRRRQHLGAHHPSDGLSAQRVRGTRELRRVGRFQRTAQLQRQPQSQSAVRLRRRQQQRAFPAGRRGQCEVGALSFSQTEIKRELLISDLSLLDFSISQADSFFLFFFLFESTSASSSPRSSA